MITAESRDFRVATYSVVSITGISFAVSTFTGIPAEPCGAAPRTESPLQATLTLPAQGSPSASPRFGRKVANILPESATACLSTLRESAS
jgi:hypothetical protein